MIEDKADWLDSMDGKRRPRRRYYEITGTGRLLPQEAAQSSTTSTLRPGHEK